MSFAKENIKKHQRREAIEDLKIILTMAMEAITAVGIFVLGAMWFLFAV